MLLSSSTGVPGLVQKVEIKRAWRLMEHYFFGVQKQRVRAAILTSLP